MAQWKETLQRAEREALADMTLRDLVLKTEESGDQDIELDGAVSTG